MKYSNFKISKSNFLPALAGEGDAKPNYIKEFIDTLLTAAQVKQLEAGELSDDQKTKIFAELNTSIESAGRARYAAKVEKEFDVSKMRGAWTRAETQTIDAYKALGVPDETFSAALEGVDKGRFAKIHEIGKAAIVAAKKKLIEESKNADAPRIAQLNTQLAESAAKIAELNNTLTAKGTEYENALLQRDVDYAVSGERSRVMQGIFKPDSAVKYSVDAELLNIVLDKTLNDSGLTVKKEGESFVVFKGDTALQVEGTAKNHTLETYVNDIAQKYVIKNNANPNNGNPLAGAQVKLSDKQLANVHPDVAATLQGGNGVGGGVTY